MTTPGTATLPPLKPPAPTEGPATVLIQLADIEVGQNHRSARSDDETRLTELMDGMRMHGLLQPIVLAPITGSKKAYRVVAGRRRLAAAAKLKWKEIPATIRHVTGPIHEAALRAEENITRQDLSPFELAIAVYDVFAQEFKIEAQGTEGFDAEQEARAAAIASTAERINREPAWVRSRVLIAERLAPKTIELANEGRLPWPYIEQLAKVADHEHQQDLAEQYAAGEGHGTGEYSDLKRDVARAMLSLRGVPWKLDIAFADKPACNTCSANTRNQPGLFGEKSGFCDDVADANRTSRHSAPPERKEPDEGVCTLKACFEVKRETSLRKLNGAAQAVANRVAKKTEDAPKLTPAGVAALAPDFVSAEQVVKLAKAKLAVKREVGEKTTRDKGTPAKKTAAKPDRTTLINEKLDELLTDYSAKVKREWFARAQKNPLGLTMLASFCNSDLWKDACGYRWSQTQKEKPLPKGMTFEKMLKLYQAAADAVAGLVEVEQFAKQTKADDQHDQWMVWDSTTNTFTVEQCLTLSMVLGINCGPAPTRADAEKLVPPLDHNDTPEAAAARARDTKAKTKKKTAKNKA